MIFDYVDICSLCLLRYLLPRRPESLEHTTWENYSTISFIKEAEEVIV
jgi:hypothetical protein